MSFYRLKGNFTQVSQAPAVCTNCSCKELFKQPDFNRNSGVVVVSVASLLTIVFQYYSMNWYLTWSPMLVALIVDRGLAMTSTLAVVCYQCEHIFRGFSKENIPTSVGDFDLVTFDRYRYPERNEVHS